MIILIFAPIIVPFLFLFLFGVSIYAHCWPDNRFAQRGKKIRERR